jgi:hypothetical protein
VFGSFDKLRIPTTAKYKMKNTLHFKPFTRKLNVVEWMWQVFWLKALLPSHSVFNRTVVVDYLLLKSLLWRDLGRLFTATGIAPDFNRIPF